MRFSSNADEEIKDRRKKGGSKVESGLVATLVWVDRRGSGVWAARCRYLIDLIDRSCTNHVSPLAPRLWLRMVACSSWSGGMTDAPMNTFPSSSNNCPIFTCASLQQVPLSYPSLLSPSTTTILRPCNETPTGPRPLFTTPYHSMSRPYRSFDHHRHRRARRRASSRATLDKHRVGIHTNNKEAQVGTYLVPMGNS